jgi:hypothetical protein
VLPLFPAGAWVGGAIEPGARAGLVDALAADGFEVSWAGVGPRTGRVVVLGLSETRLGL